MFWIQNIIFSREKASRQECISLLKNTFLFAFATNTLIEPTASRPRIENPRTQQHQKAFKTQGNQYQIHFYESARQKGAAANAKARGRASQITRLMADLRI